MESAVNTEDQPPRLVKWDPHWDMPTIMADCPSCGRRVKRRAVNFSYAPPTISAQMSCYPVLMPEPPCWRTFRVDVEVAAEDSRPDFEDAGSVVDEQAAIHSGTHAGGAHILGRTLPPGTYRVEHQRALVGEDGQPLGVEYLVEGRWLADHTPEACLRARAMIEAAQ